VIKATVAGAPAPLSSGNHVASLRDMSIDTAVSLKRAERNGLVVLAGLIMIFQGVFHGVSALFVNTDHWPAWLAGGISSDLAGHDPVSAAFWRPGAPQDA